MKRLALLLATSVLGTGCYVSSNTTTTPAGGTLDLGWNFVRTTPAGAKFNYTCTDAGLDNVLVQTSTGQQWQLSCTGSGGTVYDVDPGTLTITVTGRRGAAALYSSQFTNVSFGSNGAVTQLNADVYGILDDLDIYALFRSKLGNDVGWSTCALAGVQELTYVIQDWRGTTNASGTVACADPAGLSFTGSGALERDNYVIRMMGYPSSTATVETFDSATTAFSPTCSGQAFNHFGNDITTAGWTVELFDVTTNATVCP